MNSEQNARRINELTWSDPGSHRGTAEARASSSPSFRFHSLRAIPWQRLDAPATGTALRRYVQERVQNRFGVYVGGAETGQIASLSSELSPLSNKDIDAGRIDAKGKSGA